MQKIKSDHLIDQLIADTETIIKTVKIDFILLDDEQLCWRSQPDKRSIGECFKHLTATLDIYLPAIETESKNLPPEYAGAAQIFYPTFMGNMATNSMKPLPEGKIRYKMKTFNTLDPRKITNQNEETLGPFLAR